KKDQDGKPLPYLDSVRLDIQRNRDIELLRFRRGEIHLIDVLDAEYFDRLQKETPAVAHDAGTGLDSEFVWFNQVPTAPFAENKTREQMVAMIQQDLSQIGIKVNLVTLDFPSLIERITRTYDYEACLLGLVNTDLDPNSQMNVWLSSAENHQWNPKQSKPATAWEAELDRLMRAQASATSDKKRKADWDRVQQIVGEQQPFIYLVNKDAMSAVSPA